MAWMRSQRFTEKSAQLKKIFPDTELEDLRRPDHVELPISHHEGELTPQREKVVRDLVLSDSPLGKGFGGVQETSVKG